MSQNNQRFPGSTPRTPSSSPAKSSPTQNGSYVPSNLNQQTPPPAFGGRHPDVQIPWSPATKALTSTRPNLSKPQSPLQSIVASTLLANNSQVQTQARPLTNQGFRQNISPNMMPYRNTSQTVHSYAQSPRPAAVQASKQNVSSMRRTSLQSSPRPREQQQQVQSRSPPPVQDAALIQRLVCCPLNVQYHIIVSNFRLFFAFDLIYSHPVASRIS